SYPKSSRYHPLSTVTPYECHKTQQPLLVRFFLLILPPQRRIPLFPYTTLFRSLTSTRTVCQRSNANKPLWTSCYTIRRLVPIKRDRKSTRLNSSHVSISYAVFCLKKKKQYDQRTIKKHNIQNSNKNKTTQRHKD